MFPSARVAAPFALLLAALLPTVSVASTPASGTTRGCSGAGANPGVYNLEINGYPAKIFNDIVLQLPIDTGFFVEDPAVITRALHRRHVDELILNNLILYIDMDGEGVLFDGGFGPSETPFGSGRLFELLAGEGISMESIKHILVTHGHVDHIAGLVEGLDSFKPAFTEATIHMSRLEYEWWTSDPVRSITLHELIKMPPMYCTGFEACFRIPEAVMASCSACCVKQMFCVPC